MEDEGEDEIQKSRHVTYLFLALFVEGRSRAAMTVARFDPAGKHVFLGTSSAHVLVFNTRTKTVNTIDFLCHSFIHMHLADDSTT